MKEFMRINSIEDEVTKRIKLQKKRALLNPHKESIFQLLSLEIYKSRSSKRAIMFYQQALKYDIQSF